MSAGPIYAFRGEWNCFSNLWNHPIEIPQVVLPPIAALPNAVTTLARTNEHAFVVGKIAYVDRSPEDIMADIEWVLEAKTGLDAKRRGSARGEELPNGEFRTIPLRSDWETRKFAVMLACLRAKYKRDNDVGQKLMSSGYRLLVEGNTWRDVIWGATKSPEDWPTPPPPCWGRYSNNGGGVVELRGLNWLGRLSMLRRDELDCGVRL